MNPAYDRTTIIYRRLPVPLGDHHLKQLFSPNQAEIQWANSVTRTGQTCVGLLAQLKAFEFLGYSPSLSDIPISAMHHIAIAIELERPTKFNYIHKTFYRHRRWIRHYLGVSAWNSDGNRLVKSVMQQSAATRPNPSDLINAAIEALLKARIELPALSTLRRLAGLVQQQVHEQLYSLINSRLTFAMCRDLAVFLAVEERASTSPFSRLRQSAGSATRKNTRQLIDRLYWLKQFPATNDVLTGIADARISQWADEAQRLTVAELRNYNRQRRTVLLLCLLNKQHARLLDDLATIYLNTIRQLQSRAKNSLKDWLAEHQKPNEQLLNVFRDCLREFRDITDPIECHTRVSDRLNREGGATELMDVCEVSLNHGASDWRAFTKQPYRSQRSVLLDIAEVLPFGSLHSEKSVLKAAQTVTTWRSVRDPWIALETELDFLSRKWMQFISDPEYPDVYKRRELEIAVLVELAAGLRAGDIYIEGSHKFGNYQSRLFTGDSDTETLSSLLGDERFPSTPAVFVQNLRTELDLASRALERSVGRDNHVQLDETGKPVVHRTPTLTPPASLDELSENLNQRLPQRTILEALYNTDSWVGWSKHFGPPSRLNSQIENPKMRYALTAFTYGCGLTPADASRHFDEPVSEYMIRFTNRRHIGIEQLRGACNDLINLYARFELPSFWGQGESAAADGSLIETYTNNLVAAYHVRYRRTGGISYRHVADNYVALFSQFVICGVHEAVYILDGILNNTSDLHPNRLHADSHGQSEAVFGLAYLLGIELMPRIRNWRSLTLYRSSSLAEYTKTRHLYGGTVDWALLTQHWDDYLQLVLAIRNGSISPSAILVRLNSYSRRNPLYRALQALGRIIRTIYLLNWILDDELRAQVTRATNKVESFHAFSQHLNFGSGGISRTNDPAELEKRSVYNQLVCNAVMLQNVADQTRVLNDLHNEGHGICDEALRYLSPYTTHNLKRFGEYRANYPAEPSSNTFELLALHR